MALLLVHNACDNIFSFSPEQRNNVQTSQLHSGDYISEFRKSITDTNADSPPMRSMAGRPIPSSQECFRDAVGADKVVFYNLSGQGYMLVHGRVGEKV